MTTTRTTSAAVAPDTIATDRAPHRTRARAAGLLFLAAMFTYGPGSGIVAAFLDAPDFLTRLAERPMLFTTSGSSPYSPSLPWWTRPAARPATSGR